MIFLGTHRSKEMQPSFEIGLGTRYRPAFEVKLRKNNKPRIDMQGCSNLRWVHPSEWPAHFGVRYRWKAKLLPTGKCFQ